MIAFRRSYCPSLFHPQFVQLGFSKFSHEMKVKHSASRDLGVFDFKEEEEVAEEYCRWSKISNPNSEDPAMKYQFLQYASASSITQMKGHMVEHVHVVAIDDDDDGGFISDITRAPLDLLENTTVKQSETFDIPDGAFIEYSVDQESSCQGMEVNASRHLRSSAGNDHICFTIPESPSTNGSIDARTPDGHDTIQENSPSTPTSPAKENSVTRDVEADEQPASSLEKEDVESIVLHTDYVTYSNKYFPASLILFSKSSVKVEPLYLEDDSGSSRLEWEIDNIVSIESHWSSLISMAKVKVHFSTKDGEQEANAQDISVVEVLEFLVHDPGWRWTQECILSLDKRYKSAWSIGLKGKSSDGDAFLVENSKCSSYPYIPNFEEPFEEVVYPEGDVDPVSVSKRDVDLLEPETFINDTIIDFYIKYLKNQIPPQERHRYHFFNSFFFRKLADLDKNPINAFDSKAAFQRVRKWTRKVNIFERDYIFIPVNYNLHWSLIVICHPGEVANFNCESMNESLKVPCILHMDSIRGSHTGLKDLFQSYLLEEWKEKQKETSEKISSNFLNLRFLSLELPQQENCSDCGLFLLHYVELFIAEAPVNFNPFVINKFENFLKPDWFVPAEASLKRVHIQRLIYELLESRTQSSTSLCCHESYPSTQPENNGDNGIEVISEKRGPGNTWNTNLSYLQSVQGIEMGLLDASVYANYDSGLGMRDLLEHHQYYEQGASSGQLGCQNLREEGDADERLARPTLGNGGFQPVDGMASGACGTGYLSRDGNAGFACNSESSDHAGPEGNTSPTSSCSSDDSQDMEIIEFDPEKYGANSGQKQNFDHFKENVDSLTESYASASSDIMGTPIQDFPEQDEINGRSHQEQEDEPLGSNQEEELQPSDQEPIMNEDHERMVVKDSDSSDSDEQQTTKRIRLDSDRTLVRSLFREM